MLRLNLPALLLSATLGGGIPAAAQQAPATRLDDLQVSQDGSHISILVKLSEQPRAAAATVSGGALILEIDGVSITPFSTATAPGSLFTQVTVDASQPGASSIRLEGIAAGSAETVVYRNAVLIEADFTEPAPNPPQSLPAPPALPALVARPPQPPHAIPTAYPPSADELNMAQLASLDFAACEAARSALAANTWEIQALGDQALCLLDAGKSPEAAGLLDQLEAFKPEDWRVALGRALLAAEAGDTSRSEIGLRTAAMLAPDATVRAALMQRANSR